MMIKRVKIGILGMDEIFYGGIFERNVVFFSGGFGIGKLIFLQQFFWNGFQMGELGIYVVLEEYLVQVR